MLHARTHKRQNEHIPEFWLGIQTVIFNSRYVHIRNEIQMDIPVIEIHGIPILISHNEGRIRYLQNQPSTTVLPARVKFGHLLRTVKIVSPAKEGHYMM